MISYNKALYDIWQTYQSTIDCFKVTVTSIEKKEYHLLNRTNFITASPKKAEDVIGKSRSNADDYVILALWVVFERRLVDYLQYETKKISENNDLDFKKNFQNELEKKIEYWKLDEVLDVFKKVIDSELIGIAKQIKKYRDWIAHKNPKKAAPSKVTPKTVYETLSNIIEELSNNPNLEYNKES